MQQHESGMRTGLEVQDGLAIGWNAELHGLSSLALLAASARAHGEVVGAATTGGHGELFVQEFDGDSLEPRSELRNLPPPGAAEAIRANLVVGSGAAQVVNARGWGEARDGFPSAADAFLLPHDLRTRSAKPVYARAPDARALEPA